MITQHLPNPLHTVKSFAVFIQSIYAFPLLLILAGLSWTPLAHALPSPPTGLTATATSYSSISVSWNAMSGASYYYWQIQTSSTFNGSWGSGTGFVASGYTTGTTSLSRSGLNASTTYYIFVASVDSGWAWNTWSTTYVITPAAPPPCVTPGTPVSLGASVTGQTTATISWWVGTPEGSASRSYEWEVYQGGSRIRNGSTSSTSVSVSGLSAGTAYSFRVRAFTSCNSTYSSWSGYAGFTTLAQPPSVTTTAASSVGPDYATMGGNVTSQGGATVTERGVVWSSSTSSPTTSNYHGKRAIGSGTGSFSQQVTGLTAATTYHVRAYAINSGGTSYGATQSFTSMSFAQAVAAAKAALTISYASGDSASNVTQGFSVATSGLYGTTISWASSNDNSIRVTGGTADVFRPWDGDKAVTLTATIARSGASDTKGFALTVRNQPLTLSGDAIASVLPSKIHMNDTKRVTVAGSGFRAYLDKSQIDFRVVKGGWSASIPAAQITILNDTTMVLIVPVDTAAPAGSYSLQFNHNTLADISKNDAYEITSDPAFMAPRIEKLRIESDKSGLDVSIIEIQGEFEQNFPGNYSPKQADQVITFNNVLKLKVAGDDLAIDTRSGRMGVSGSGRFYMDVRDRSGLRTTTTIYEGSFELDGFDLVFAFTGPPKLNDLLGVKMDIGATSMAFSQPDRLTLSGIMTVGFNAFGAVGAQINVETIQASLSGFDLVASFDVSTSLAIGPFKAPRLHVGIDTLTPQYAFGAGAEIPKLGYGFDLDFTIYQGKLDKISFLIRKDIEVPQYGFKITSFGGGAENIANRSSGPLTFMALGNISDMVSPEIFNNNMLNLSNLRIGVSEAHLDAYGEASIYGFISVGSAQFVAVWNPGAHPRYTKAGFDFTGQANIVDVIVGTLNAAYWEGESFRGLYDARLQIPGSVPLIGGKSLSKTTISTDTREARAEKSIIGIGFVLKYGYQSRAVSFDVSGALKKIAEAAMVAARAVAQAAVVAAKAVAKAAVVAYEATKKAVVAAANFVAKGVVSVANSIYNTGKKVVATVQKVWNSPAANVVKKAVTSTVKSVGKSISKGFKKLFCEEGRDAIAVYVAGERYALIEVTGMVTGDLVVQAPDYDWVPSKADATRYFQETSGYLDGRPPEYHAEEYLVPYNPETGEGNYLYLPDEGKAYVVMYLDQVGFWTFIDWGWLEHYTDPVIRGNVLSYASVSIYELTPGADMHFVVNNILVAQETTVLEFLDTERVLLAIETSDGDVVIRNPNSGEMPIQTFEGDPEWNALYVPDNNRLYVIADVYPGDWQFIGDGIGEVQAYAIDAADLPLSTAEQLARVRNAPVSSLFALTAEDIAEGKVLLVLDGAPDDFRLLNSRGTEVPVIFEGTGQNAERDAVNDKVYLLLNVGYLDSGEWTVEAGKAIANIYAVGQSVSQTLSAMTAAIAAAPSLFNTTYELMREGDWLFKVKMGNASALSVRNPSLETIVVTQLAVEEYGVDYVYCKVDVTNDSVGSWEVTTDAAVSIEVYRIWDSTHTLEQLAQLHRDGAPHLFVVEVSEMGRLLFEIQLDVPSAMAATFTLVDVIDSIEVIDYAGDLVPVIFNESDPDWNAYYNDQDRRLFVMADAFGTGYWHIDVDYGSSMTVSSITGDPEGSMDNLKSVADGEVEYLAEFELKEAGYYLLEITGGDSTTTLASPDAVTAMTWNAYVLDAANSRIVGDTLFVLLHTVIGARDQFWKIRSDEPFSFAPSRLELTNPELPLTIAEMLDGEVAYPLDFPDSSRWAIHISSFAADELGALRLVKPDTSEYAFTFLPEAEFANAENFPHCNALYDSATGQLLLTVDAAAGEGGTWQLYLPGRRPVELMELGFIPTVESFDVAAVSDEGENVFDVAWSIAHPRVGSTVRIGIVSVAAVAARNLAAPSLASGLAVAGTERIQCPEGMVPGDYHFVLYVENPESGIMVEVHPEPVAVTYATAPQAPKSLRIDRIGNGEIRLLFDDPHYLDTDKYLLVTHLLAEGEQAGDVAVEGFRGPTLEILPTGGGGGSGSAQLATLSGLETGQSYLVSAFAMTELAAMPGSYQFSLASNVVELDLPEPDYPELTFTVVVAEGYTSSALTYELPVVTYDYERDGNGDPIFDDFLDEYRVVEVERMIEERAWLINANEATLSVSVDNSPAMSATFEFSVDGSVVDTVTAAATTADFALSGLQERAYTMQVAAVNANGDRRVLSERLLVDLTAPHLFVFGPSNGRIFFTNTVIIEGETEPSATLQILHDGQAVNAGLIDRDADDGSFSVTLSGLAWDSLHTFEITATDAAGNATTRSLQVYVLEIPDDLPDDNADLVSLDVQNATLSAPFDSKTTSYSGTTSASTVYFAPASVSPTSAMSISVNGSPFEEVDPQEGYAAALGSGSNTVVLRVTSGDGNSTQDYSFDIQAPMQTTPEIMQWPTASAIDYGQQLAESELADGSATVDGMFFWTSPGVVPPAGVSSQSVTFIPDDEVNYTSVSGNASVTAFLASQVVLTTAPVGGASGAALALQPVVEIRDSAGRLVTTDNTRVVTVSIANGSGGTLGGTQSVTVIGGIGTYSDLTLAGLVGETYTLIFSASGIDSAAAEMTVSAGAPSAVHSTISASQPLVTVDESAGVTLSVQLRDAQGNVISTDAATVGISSGFDFGIGSGLSAVTYVGNGQYVATTASSRAGTASFAATINGMSVVDPASVAFLADVPATAELVTQPGETVAGLPIHPAPRVVVLDRFGNPVAAGISVRVAVAAGSGSIVSGESITTVTTDAQGRATFSGLIIEDAAADYQLEFTVLE